MEHLRKLRPRKLVGNTCILNWQRADTLWGIPYMYKNGGGGDKDRRQDQISMKLETFHALTEMSKVTSQCYVKVTEF